MNLDKAHAHHLLREMIRIRRLEEKSAELYGAMKIRGFLHLYIGEEAVAVGVLQSIRPEDAVVSTYREHGHALVRGMPARSILAEMLGKQEGCRRGRGGSMHLFDRATRFYGGNAIVGGGLPLAVGLANGVKCLDTGGQQVGEDIIWHSVNGKEYMFVTFMGGTGVDQPDCGSVGVFDPQSNAVIKIIQARKSLVAKGAPYIMYPHGMSAYQDRLVVSSTVHPDLATGVGNAITIIDLNTLEPIQNIVVEDAKPVGFPSSPVEVLFVRPGIVPGVTPAVLVNTMFGFETWKIPYSEADKSFGAPVKAYDGVQAGTGVPLEFYGNATELFLSHAVPGIVKRYKLSSLPDLVPSGADIKAEAGAHHMIFCTTAAGRKVIAIHNNLLNLLNKP